MDQTQAWCHALHWWVLSPPHIPRSPQPWQRPGRPTSLGRGAGPCLPHPEGPGGAGAGARSRPGHSRRMMALGRRRWLQLRPPRAQFRSSSLPGCCLLAFFQKHHRLPQFLNPVGACKMLSAHRGCAKPGGGHNASLPSQTPRTGGATAPRRSGTARGTGFNGAGRTGKVGASLLKV